MWRVLRRFFAALDVLVITQSRVQFSLQFTNIAKLAINNPLIIKINYLKYTSNSEQYV